MSILRALKETMRQLVIIGLFFGIVGIVIAPLYMIYMVVSYYFAELIRVNGITDMQIAIIGTIIFLTGLTYWNFRGNNNKIKDSAS